MIERFSKRRDEDGFTLIELLVVIVILGVLSAVVVFAVRGAGDKGQSSALKIDARTVRTAEEAFCAQNGRFGTMEELHSSPNAKFLSEKSTMTDVALAPGGPCKGSGVDDSKSGFILGYKEPNAGSPPASTGYPELKLAVTGTGSGVYPTPFEWGFGGPAQQQMNLMFDPLLWKDATGMEIPWLTTSVPTIANGGVSADGKSYTFTLRSNVKWQDSGVVTAHNPSGGDQFLTADDVKFTVDYQNTGGAANTVTPCWCKTALTNISSVVVNSPTSITFNLTKAVNTFFQDIGWGMVILPKHIWQNITTSTSPSITSMHTSVEGYMGTGAYKLLNPLSYVPSGGSCGGCSQYDANTSFFLGTPYVRRLTYKLPGSGITGLQTKTIDAGSVGSNDGITTSDLNALSGLSRVTAPGGGNTVVHFNLTKGFPYNEVRFRQAAAYAIDRNYLLQAIAGGRGKVSSMGSLAPSHPMLAPGLPTYDLGTRAANVAKAKDLLDQLGIVDTNADGKRECPVANPCALVSNTGAVTTSVTPTNFNPNLYGAGSPSTATATAIQQNLADVGLDFALATGTNFQAQNGYYGMQLVGWGNTMQDPDILRVRLDSSYTAVVPSFWNIYGWNNTANATSFMAKAQDELTTTDPIFRKKRVQEMQELVAADVPQISLFTADVWFFYQAGSFSSWYNTPNGTPPGPPGFFNKHVFVTGKQFGLPAGY
ncbi:MAG TPA: ABC transporter substrate-binding protein [Acidimicrobiales bacterium]|nr:ABC transporter substrate-binding protein [Acidimicrobiales bacterium]